MSDEAKKFIAEHLQEQGVEPYDGRPLFANRNYIPEKDIQRLREHMEKIQGRSYEMIILDDLVEEPLEPIDEAELGGEG